MADKSASDQGAESIKPAESRAEANVDHTDLQTGASQLELKHRSSRQEGYAKDQAYTVSPDGKGAFKELVGRLRESGEGLEAKQVRLVKDDGGTASDKSAVGGPPEASAESADGERIQRDDVGKVTHLTYPDNSSRDFEYTADGRVNKLTYKNAEGAVVDQWQLGEDGKYHQYKPDAAGTFVASGETWDGKVTISKTSGDLTYQETGSEDTVTERAASGATITESKDGPTRVENQDGSGYERTKTANGGYTESHWGTRQTDNYEITRTADGKYLVADAPGAPPREVTDNNDPRVERAKLVDQAAEKIKDPEKLREFQENIDRFEERAKEQGLSPEEIARTYHEISRLMETDKDAKIPEAERIELAEQVMSQAADPTTIDQGYHNTCNVASLESRLYSKNPSAVAQMVADIAHEGQYTTPTGVTVELLGSSLKPDQEAKKPDSDDRSYASQLFQVTAVNIHYQKNGYTDANGKEYPPGTIRYEQREAKPGHPKDTGERLLDTSKHPPKVITDRDGKPVDEPSIGEDEVTGISNEITGRHDSDIVINHADRGDNVTIAVDSEQHLKDELARAKAEKRLPIMIVVNTQNEPFYSDSGAGAAGGSGGWHMVTITDYDADTGKVSIDNQWGESVDHQGKGDAVEVSELYVAMRDPEKAQSIDDLKADIARHEAAGEPHPIEDIELLRRQFEQGTISAKELTDAMMKAGVEFYKKGSDPTASPEERALYRTAWGKLADIAEQFPKDKYPDLDWDQWSKDFLAATAAAKRP